MGVDLVPIGNHKISFKNTTIVKLASKITSILNNATFPNPDFLKDFALNSNKYQPDIIREINTKQSWAYKICDQDYGTEKSKSIKLYGPFALTLTFKEHFIRFGNPLYRYWVWFGYNQLHQNEWRKYMYFIVNLFGGDRVLYAADSSIFLEKYTYYEGSFEEMERELIEKYGKPKISMDDVDDSKMDYLIDNFNNIDWNHVDVFDTPRQKPDDKSSIDFDLLQFADKEILKNYYFFDYILLHKIIANKIHYYHLSTIDKLIVIHKGVVDGEENIEVVFDENTAFLFQNLLNSREQDGYEVLPNKHYIIYFKGQENYDGWKVTIDQFISALIWSGLGMYQRSYRLINNEEYGLHMYFVDERQALELLLDLGKRNRAIGKFILYYNEDDYTSFDYSDQNVTNNNVIYKHC